MRAFRAPILVLFVLVCACSSEGVALRVDFRSDLEAGVDVAELLVELEGMRVERYVVVSGARLLPGVAVARFEDLPPGEYTVRVTLFRRDGARLGARRVRVNVQSERAVTVVFSRACLPVECPGANAAATECNNGQCVPPECFPENPEPCGSSICAVPGDCPTNVIACAQTVCDDGLCWWTDSEDSCPPDQVCGLGGCVSTMPDDAGGIVDGGRMDGGFDADAMSDAGDADADAGDCDAGAPCDTGIACERGVIECSSGAPVCVSAGAREAGVVCRPAASPCDVAEMCDGELPLCPVDEFVMTGTPCAGGFCASGRCGPCEPGVACETGNACEVGRVRCDGDIPVCEAASLAPAGSLCRASAGVCDVPETCTGDSAVCPADDVAAPGTMCRAGAGACDVGEVCDGASAACPPDRFAAPSTACREARGVCDVAEQCTGSGASCPPDMRATVDTMCRRARGECDVAEFCSGTADTCPDDAFVPAGGECSDSRVCDGLGGCLDLGCGDACSTGNACEVGIIDCGSGAPVCVRDRFRRSGVVCRASAGVCDATEVCDGTSAECPADGFARRGTGCRASVGECDIAEVCTGRSATCPSDALVGAGTECRAAEGLCDVAESCDGVMGRCPSDRFVEAGTMCGDEICEPIDECRLDRGGCAGTTRAACRPQVCDGSSAGCGFGEPEEKSIPCFPEDGTRCSLCGFGDCPGELVACEGRCAAGCCRSGVGGE